MFNDTTAQQQELFRHFASRWQAMTGSQLYLLSPEGDLWAGANDRPPAPWPKILKHTSSVEATFLDYFGPPILTAPLIQNDQLAGYLLAIEGKKRDAPLLSWGGEILMARWLETQALQDMTDELIAAWDQLELIYRVTRNLAFTPDLTTALHSILQEICQVLDTEDGFILLEHNDTLLCVTYVSHRDKGPFDDILLDRLIYINHTIVSNDIDTHQQIWADVPTSIETLLATPLLITEEQARAAIGLINKANKNFTAGDAKLLAAVAQQVATIIKNFLSHQRLIFEERLSRELEIAAEIQSSFVPAELPQLEGLSLAVSSTPASEVGGDFYDFIKIANHQLTLMIGDVAGKGIPAAMLTSVTKTMLRVGAIRGEPPHTIIQQANNVLHEELSRADSFVTTLVTTIDTTTGQLSYASAGHVPALLWRAESGAVEQLRATSPPLGIFGYEPDASNLVDLSPGDTIVFYTDGIIEFPFLNPGFSGLQRLIELVQSRAGESPQILQELIKTDMLDFDQDANQRDDATILTVKFLPQPEAQVAQPQSPPLKTVNYTYPADTQYLSDISQEIAGICRELPTLPAGSNGDDFVYLIELAISEICTNIIKHAYAGTDGQITGQITLFNEGVQLDFYDQGQSFNPKSLPQSRANPHKLKEGGYGLHIVRQIMDIVTYHSTPTEGNHWQLIKYISPPAL